MTLLGRELLIHLDCGRFENIPEARYQSSPRNRVGTLSAYAHTRNDDGAVQGSATWSETLCRTIALERMSS